MGRPGVVGHALDRAGAAAAINAAAGRTGGRGAEAALIDVLPSLPTEKAEAMGFKDKLSSFTTKYSCPSNRRTNVQITAQYATSG
jgi:hypothetical protein